MKTPYRRILLIAMKIIQSEETDFDDLHDECKDFIEMLVEEENGESNVFEHVNDEMFRILNTLLEKIEGRC